jgi:hypothetical protein
MAVAVRMEIPGATTKQYDQVCRMAGLTPQGAGPDGLLFHSVTPVESGVVINDVWQDRGKFDEFREQIRPYSRQAGLPKARSTQFLEVHDYLTAN